MFAAVLKKLNKNPNSTSFGICISELPPEGNHICDWYRQIKGMLDRQSMFKFSLIVIGNNAPSWDYSYIKSFSLERLYEEGVLVISLDDFMKFLGSSESPL